MTEPKKNLKRKHLLFWITLPVLILLAALPFYTNFQWNSRDVVAVGSLDVFCILLAFTIYDAKKFWWAGRSLALLLFLLCAIYLSSQIFRGVQEKTLYPEGADTSSSVPNALKTFFLLGLPCAGYAIFGNDLFSRWRRNKG